jgi:tetratricopeptide (TPR) repeat protein
MTSGLKKRRVAYNEINPFCILLALTLFFLNSFFTVIPGRAAELEEHTDAASIMAFAESLFRDGQHYRAMIENERFIYFNPKHPDTPKARYTIGCAMKSTGNYTSALELFTSLAEEYEGIAPGIESSFQKAETFYLMYDFPSALKHYTQFLLRYPQHQLAEKARSAIEQIEKQSP